MSVAPSGEVKVAGDAAVAPKVDTKSSASKVTIPEASTIVFNEKLGTMTLTFSKASEITVSKNETAIQGPVAFTPEKGPTVAEESKAKADFWTLLGLRVGTAVGTALAVFGLVRMWNLVMYGGVAIAAACLFGLFVHSHPVLLLFIGLGVAAVVIGPTVWHLQIKKLVPPTQPQVPTNNETDGSSK